MTDGAGVPMGEDRHHPFFYIGGVFVNAVVFLAIGPIVGGCALVTAAAILDDPLRGPFLGPASYLLLFFVTVPVSYFHAAPAAAITGALVAIISIWITRSRYLYPLAGVIGAIVAVVCLSTSDFPVRGERSPTSLPLFAVAGFLAAVACTRIARPFRLSVPAGEPLNHARAMEVK